MSHEVEKRSNVAAPAKPVPFTHYEDAEMTLRRAIDAVVEGLEGMPEAGNLIMMGMTMRRENERLNRELERRTAQVAHLSRGAPPTGGASLELGRSPGGARHFLGGRSVSAGAHLYLLTTVGWMSGTYEWNFTPEDAPSLYFRLPGCGDRRASLKLPPGAILAWPDEMASS
jgi:hypothetical protein